MVDSFKYTVEDEKGKILFETRDQEVADKTFIQLKKQMVSGKSKIKILSVYCLEHLGDLNEWVKVQTKCHKS